MATHRDIRSASISFKRDKDHGSKWSLGSRPSLKPFDEGKVRPNKAWTHDHKSHQNKTPKTTSINISYTQAGVANRLVRKVDAINDAHEHKSTPLSKSLLELLPQDDIPGILYSFDKGSSPNESGRSVDLGCLVEEAEKKWRNDQTDKMIQGEYEVLDNEGEVIKRGKKTKKETIQDEDDFEFI